MKNKTYDDIRVSRRQGWNLVMSARPPVFHSSNHSVQQWRSERESLTSGGEAEAVRAVLQMLQHQHHLDTAAAVTLFRRIVRLSVCSARRSGMQGVADRMLPGREGKYI